MKIKHGLFWGLVSIASIGSILFPGDGGHSLAFLPLLIGGLASLASGVVGGLANASAQDRASMLQEKGMREWFELNIPDPIQRKLALEKFVQQGELHPALEQSVKAESSELNNVQQDPGLRDSRMRALRSLEDIGSGGENVQDAAALQKAMIESGAASRGRQEAVLGSLGRRGQLGGGDELMARLSMAQGDADRNASSGLDLEMNRRNRALQALQGAGSLAGDIQGQDYQMASDRAKANDAINQFNTSNLINMNARNVASQNDASKYNLNLGQDVSDKNTGLANFQQQYNKELTQQDFENRKSKAAGLSGQYGNQANQAMQQGQSAANMWGGIASGIGNLTGSYMLSQKKKEDDYL